jgi:hypothetical protein
MIGAWYEWFDISKCFGTACQTEKTHDLRLAKAQIVSSLEA